MADTSKSQGDTAKQPGGLDLKQHEADQDRREKLARKRQDDAAKASEGEGASPQTVAGPGVPDPATRRAELGRAAATQAERSGIATTQDSATATSSIAVPTDVKGPAPFADADELRPSQVLLPRSRVNGTFEGGEYTLGSEDEPWAGKVAATVFNLFGGPDRDVALRLRVQSRRDSTVPWEEAEVVELGEIDEAGSVEQSVSLVGPSRVVGSVVGSSGGHTAEVEVLATKS